MDISRVTGQVTRLSEVDDRDGLGVEIFKKLDGVERKLVVKGVSHHVVDAAQTEGVPGPWRGLAAEGARFDRGLLWGG